MRELQNLAMSHPAAMGTLMYMCTTMSRSNALVVSQKAIGDAIGATRETVNKAIKLLTAHNFIQVIKAGGNTVYVVNSRVAWQGERGARYAAFGADVIALESEQLGTIDDLPPEKRTHPSRQRAPAGRKRADRPTRPRRTRPAVARQQSGLSERYDRPLSPDPFNLSRRPKWLPQTLPRSLSA